MKIKKLKYFLFYIKITGKLFQKLFGKDIRKINLMLLSYLIF